MTWRSSIPSSKAACALGGGPVDLVRQEDLGEDGAGTELEALAALVEEGEPGDVGREQIRGALQAPEGAVEAAGEGAREEGLAHPGDVLQQDVALGEEGHQDQLHGRLEAHHHPAHGLLEACRVRTWATSIRPALSPPPPTPGGPQAARSAVCPPRAFLWAWAYPA